MEWRHHFQTSPARLARIALVGLIVFAILWALPSLARVDFLRPRIIEKLQSLSEHPISLGHIYIRALPRPGLIATDLIVGDPNDAAHPLIQVHQIGLRFYIRPLFSLKLRLLHLTLSGPHFYIRRELNGQWPVIPTLAPSTQQHTSPNPYPLQGITVHDGEIDFSDETLTPPLHLALKSIEIIHDLLAGQATLEARDPALGSQSKVLITYDQKSLTPLHIRMGQISTRFLKSYLPSGDWSEGTMDLEGLAHAPALGIFPNRMSLEIENCHLKALDPITLEGRISMSTETFHIDLHTKGATVESYLDIKSPWPRDQPIIARISWIDLSPEIAHLMTFSSWVSRLHGRGHIDGLFHYQPRAGTYDWQATAHGFTLEGTSYQFTQIFCSSDALELHVHVAAQDSKGPLTVEWVSPTSNPTASLTVDASTVSVRDALQILDLPTEPPTASISDGPRHFRTTGYQDLVLEDLHFESTLTPGKNFTLVHSAATLEDSDLTITGHVDLSTPHPHVILQGIFHEWPVQAFVAHFMDGAPILDGTGDASFNFQLDAETDWIKTLTGQVALKLTDGTLYQFKNFYRVESLIDISNYFKLRIPNVDADGIPFDDLEGTINLTNGVIKTDNLFLSSPDTKIAAHGTIDLAAQRVDMTIEFQALRFVEDVITHIPGLHWIFKGGHHIILPIPVHIKGPFDDMSAS